MAAITLEELGLTQQDLQERVVQAVAAELLESVSFDEDDNEYRHKSSLRQQLDKVLQERIDAAVAALADDVCADALPEFLTKFVLHPTNSYGERRGEDIPFAEYITSRADEYLGEKVRDDGQKSDSYRNDKPLRTRLLWLVDEKLHASIDAAVKNALEGANNDLAARMQSAVVEAVGAVAASVKAG
jgi:hypothetical protein